MAVPSRQRTPNPHLGAYYGIVASTFVSLVVLLAIAEQLGWSHGAIAQAMILAPLLLYIGIAALARTLNVEDFFVSGRRVPQVYNAFLLAAVTVGGTGFFAYTGALFFVGFDGLAIGLGWTCGLLLAAVLFVPSLRRAGAYTLPAFLSQRFRSLQTRMAASLLQIVPTSLLLAAEVQIAATVVSTFLSIPLWFAVLLVVVFVAATGILGGIRALTWSGSAQFIAGAIGLAVPLITVAVLMANLPAPQFIYGEMLRSLQSAETALGVVPIEPGAVAVLPGAGPAPAAKPFAQAFGAITESGFFALFACIALGTAALPSLLSRSGVTGSVADQRRSTAWALLLVALFVITAPSIAVFAKLLMFREMALVPTEGLPAWLSSFGVGQLAQVKDLNGDGAIAAAELLVSRDGIALVLPVLAQLPYIFAAVIAAAGLGIALAAAGSHLFTLGASLSDDIYGTLETPPLVLPRLMAAWGAIAGSGLLIAVFLFVVEVDALSNAVTALAFAAATFFPILVLSTWWPRCTVWGSFASLGTGFMVLFLVLTAGGLFGLVETAVGTATASLIAAILALGAGVGASLYGPAPTSAELDYFEAMRRPDSETLYDRAEARAAQAPAE